MSFEIRLQPSGRTFSVQEDEPILTAGLADGVKMPYGCRMGTCCSCRGRVVSGDVDLGDAHLAYLPQAQRDDGFALLCRATAKSDVVIELEELPDIAPPVETPAILKSAERLSDDVMYLQLRLPLHLNLRFKAGQFVDFRFADGLKRSYSIANASIASGVINLEFHIRHMEGGYFTDRLFAGLKSRERFDLHGPLGSFFLRDSDLPALMVASGTGYAPIRSILLTELAENPDRQFHLYWGARTRADLYLREEAQALADANDNLEFVPVLSEPTAADGWSGRTGFVHKAVMNDFPDMAGVEVYACGAPVMVDAAREDFGRQCGLPDTRFFSDSFVSEADSMVTA